MKTETMKNENKYKYKKMEQKSKFLQQYQLSYDIFELKSTKNFKDCFSEQY